MTGLNSFFSPSFGSNFNNPLHSIAGFALGLLFSLGPLSRMKSGPMGDTGSDIT